MDQINTIEEVGIAHDDAIVEANNDIVLQTLDDFVQHEDDIGSPELPELLKRLLDSREEEGEVVVN